MAKRKKRLEKGIKSMEKQIDLHKLKKEKASEEGRLELTEYYSKEIRALMKRKSNRKEKSER